MISELVWSNRCLKRLKYVCKKIIPKENEWVRTWKEKKIEVQDDRAQSFIKKIKKK